MKKILIPILILLCFFAKAQYNPSGTYLTPLNRPIGLTGKPDGGRTYLFDPSAFTYRPYVSVAEANSYITGTQRQGHFYVIINTGGILSGGVITGGINAAYWWKDGILDANLVPMNPSSSGSTNTSVGSGLSLAINGTNNVKSILADVLTFVTLDSSLPGTVRIRWDTAGFISYLISHHPFVLKVQPGTGLVVFGSLSDSLKFDYLQSNLVSQDSIGGGNLYSKINGSYVLVGSVAGGGGSTIVYNTVTDMLGVRPANGTGALTLGNLATTDLGGARYTYNSASTATSNGMTVLTPTTGSGAGRYLLVVENGEARLKQLGIFPSSDNTTAVNAAAALATGTFTIRPDVNSTYIIDPNAGGFRPLSNLTVKGFGVTSIFKAKSYSTQNKYLINRTPSGGTDTCFNFTMTNMTIDGNTQYTYPTLSGSSQVTDTLSELAHLELIRNWDIENINFQNGGNYAGLFYIRAAYGTIANCNFNFIGSSSIANDYDTLSHDILITGIKSHYFGDRDIWDLATGGAPNRRAGNDWGSFGGYNINVIGNEWWNDFKVICFSLESRHVGPAYYLNNIAHGGNSFYGGYSVGGYDAAHPLTGLVVSGNRIDSVVLRPLAAQDSVSGHLKYFAGTNYNEFTYLRSSTVSNNIFPNSSMSLGFTNKMVNVFNNTFDCSGIVANYPTAGSGSQIFFDPTLHNSVTDVDSSINFYNNTYIGGVGGEFMRIDNNGTLTKSLHIFNNPGISLNGGILAEIYKPHGPVYHQDLQINNNIVTGTVGGGGFMFYTIDSTAPGGHTFSFQNNTAGFSNFDSASNFLVNAGGAAVTAIKEGTTFLSGISSQFATNMTLSGSNLTLANRQGPIATVALPGGGGISSFGPYLTGTASIPRVDTTGLNKRFPLYVSVDEVYGTSHDIKIYTDGSMTSSSNILHSNQATFVSGDVGKIIYIKKVGPGGHAILTTISGFTNSHTVTTTASTSTAASGIIFKYGHDDTQKIQSCLSDVGIAGGGSCMLGAYPYMIAGPLIHIDNTHSDPNSQLWFPSANFEELNDTPNIVVKLTGPLEAQTQFSALDNDSSQIANRGTMLISVLVDNDGAGAVVGEAGAFYTGFGYFSSSMPFLENIFVSVPDDINGATRNGVDFFAAGNAKTNNIVVKTDVPYRVTHAPINKMFGVRMTAILGGTEVMMDGSTVVGGFNDGVMCSEHTLIYNLQAQACLNGLHPIQSNYQIHVINYRALWCGNAIYSARSDQGTTISVDQLNVEALTLSGKWNDYQSTINDTNNHFTGSVAYLFNSSNISTPSIPVDVNYGGANIDISNYAYAWALKYDAKNPTRRVGKNLSIYNIDSINAIMSLNEYYDNNSGTFKYMNDGEASFIYWDGGTFFIQSAAAGSKDGTITPQYPFAARGHHAWLGGQLSSFITGAGTTIDAGPDSVEINKVPLGLAADSVLTIKNNTVRKMPASTYGGGGTPGGSTGDLQWNSSGSFAGGGATYNGSTGLITNSKSQNAVTTLLIDNPNNGSSAGAQLKLTNDGTNGFIIAKLSTTFSGAGNDTYLQSLGAGDIVLYDGSERMRIGSGGTTTFGTVGSRLDKLIVNADSTIFNGRVGYSYATTTDANYTIPVAVATVFLSSITANRTLTMPTPSTHKGQFINLFNQNTAAFAWNFAGNVSDAAGTTISSIPNANSYILYCNGTTWAVAGLYNTSLGTGAYVNTVTYSGTAGTSGASISGSTLTLRPTDGSNPGFVSTTTQLFAGTKTFQVPPVIPAIFGNSGGTPVIGTGSGAGGGSPTASVVGSDLGMKVTVNTGTLPSASAVVATITMFATTYPTGMIVTFSPGNAATALLSGATMVYMIGTGTTQFTINSGTTGLTPATTYLWNVAIAGY